MNKNEALKMAIEAMEVTDEALNEFFEGLVKLVVPKSILKMDKHTKLIPAISACKEALEQPAQEPLTRAQQVIRANNKALKQPAQDTETMAVAIALQEQIRQLKEQSSWQGLTDDEIDAAADETDKVFATSIFWVKEFARAIEQELKEKNSV